MLDLIVWLAERLSCIKVATPTSSRKLPATSPHLTKRRLLRFFNLGGLDKAASVSARGTFFTSSLIKTCGLRITLLYQLLERLSSVAHLFTKPLTARYWAHPVVSFRDCLDSVETLYPPLADNRESLLLGTLFSAVFFNRVVVLSLSP